MFYPNVLSGLLGLFLAIFSHFVCYGNDTFKPSVVEQAKRSVVSIEVQAAFAPYDGRTQWSGNGVVLDKQAGYILTSGITIGPVVVAAYTIGFFNGIETQAKVVYYDTWLDYAVLKVDPLVIPKKTRAVKLSNKNPRIGQAIFTIAREKQKVATLYGGSITDTNAILQWTMPQHFIRVSMSTKSCTEGSLIFNEAGEGVALNCANSDTMSVGLHLNYIHYALSALKQQKIPVRKHIGALLTTYSLDDAVRYDHLSVASQKKYLKQFPNAQNKILQVEGLLHATPADQKLFPGDLIWAIDGQLVGPGLVDFDMAMNKSAKDHILLTIFRNGCYHDITLPLYNLEDHRITRMVQFGGTTFFETDDMASYLGGVKPRTLTSCIAQPNTIFKEVVSLSEQSLRIWVMELLAMNGQPIQTLDLFISVIPKLMEQKYFTMEYINYLSRWYGRQISFAHSRYKNNVEYDISLAPPKVWSWDPIELEWKGEAIVS